MKLTWTKNQNDIIENNKMFIERLNYFKGFGLDRLQLRQEVISKIDFKPDDGLLEVGTGKGCLTVGLAKEVKKVVTIDIDKEGLYTAYLNACHENVEENIEFILSSAEKIDYDDNAFDLVVSAFSFHHFERPFKIIDEMARVAKKTLIISDFNETGFFTIDQIHKHEGKTHNKGSSDFSITGIYLNSKGFYVNEYNHKFQKIYVATKQELK